MKKLYLTAIALFISAIAFSQVLVEEGFENGNTVGQTPVGWICDDGGWKAGITIPDDNEARGRKPHTGDWYMYATYNTDVWTYKEINATAGNYYRVSFWYSTWHIDHFDLEVKAGASATPSAMTVSVIPTMVVDNEEYLQTSAVFQATSTGSFYVGFHSTATNSPWYLSIDDVVIEQTSQYNFEIEQLTTDTIAYFGESVYLRFLLNNTGEQQDTYQLANTSSYPMEFYQNGSPIDEISLSYNTSAELVAKMTLPMNLSDNQTIHATFDVTSSNSAPTQSADFIVTALKPIDSYPLTEGFDGTTFPPAGWQNIATNGNYVYERYTVGEWPMCEPHNGSTAMARYYCYTSAAGSTCSMISPKLQLNSTDNIVRYWIYRNFNNNITGPDKINLYYSPTTSTADGTLLGTVHRNSMFEPVAGEVSDWYEYSYTFDSPEGYGFIIIEAESGYGWNLFIDDIYINSTTADNNPPTLISISGNQTWAETDMHLSIRLYDESDMPSQMQATYTINGQDTDVTFYSTTKGNNDYVAVIPAQPNHTEASLVIHMVDNLGNAADSEPQELHWDWQEPMLIEGFEGEQFPPSGWMSESINMSWFTWYRSGALTTGDWWGNDYYIVPPQGVKMAALEVDNSEEWGPQDEAIITPLVTLDRPAVLTFETFCQYGVTEYFDHYKVDVLNTNTGSWTTLWDAVNLPQMLNQFQEPVSIDLSAYEGQNIRVRFRGHNNGQDVLSFPWMIDDVRIMPTDTIPQSVSETSLETSLYPNPVNDIINIRAEETISQVTIYNLLSVKMMEIAINNKEAVIDLSKLDSGMYIIEMLGKNGKSVKTLIKK